MISAYIYWPKCFVLYKWRGCSPLYSQRYWKPLGSVVFLSASSHRPIINLYSVVAIIILVLSITLKRFKGREAFLFPKGKQKLHSSAFLYCTFYILASDTWIDFYSPLQLSLSNCCLFFKVFLHKAVPGNLSSYRYLHPGMIRGRIGFASKLYYCLLAVCCM